MTAGMRHSWLYFQLPIKRELLFQAAFKSLLEFSGSNFSLQQYSIMDGSKQASSQALSK